MRKYRLWLFCGNLAKLKTFYGTLKFLLTQDHMGLEISKRYSSYSFYPISSKLYEAIGYHDRIQAVTFRGDRPSLKKWALWNFNMGVDGKVLKYAISWKRLTVDQNGWKFGTCGPVKCMCRYFWCQAIWVQFGVIQCTLQSFLCDIQNVTVPLVFIQSQPNFI